VIAFVLLYLEQHNSENHNSIITITVKCNRKEKVVGCSLPPFSLHYQLVIFSPLSIMVTCQYRAGFVTSTFTYLPHSCVVQYWCSKHSQRDVLSEQFFSDQMKNVTYSERVCMILWYDATGMCQYFSSTFYYKFF
jgi:hypothetical protein